MANKISVLVDVATDKARASIKSLRKEMADADGLFGKAKVGMKGGMDTLKANAGAFAVSAGTAIAAFGVKAIGAFQDTARAALELSKSTGLSVEEASRWIAVADDMGVSAGDLQTALAKLPKTLDAAKWAKYGIDVRDASGAMRPMNQILLDALDVLGKIPNETERAKAGTDLLGRGFASIAPLVGKTRSEYEKMLGAVEDGQVITAEESRKSEDLRKALDKLQDALNEVTLAVGGLLSGPAGDFVDFLGDAVSGATKATDAIGKIPGAVGAMETAFNPVLGAKSAWDSLTDSVTWHADMVATLPAKYGPIGKAWEQLTSWAKGVVGPLDLAAQATARLKSAHDALLDKLDDRSAWLDMDDALASYTWNMNTGALKGRELERSLIGVQSKMVTFLDTLDNVPDVVRSRILADIDQGRLQSAKAQLDALARMRHAVVFVELAGPGRRYAGGVGPRQYLARGGRAGSDGAIAGENYRPELVDGRLVTGPTYVPPGSRVTSETDTAAMLRRTSQTVTHNSYVTVNMPAGIDPSGVARALQKYARRNGTL